jgi:hypothetical protein
VAVAVVTVPAVSGGGDARASMDVDADVVVAGDQRFARVEPHPHARLRAARPVMERESGLRVGRSLDGATRVGEGDEEAVALRIHFDAVVAPERLTQQPTVLCENICVVVPELVQQARRALDVGEEEGNCAAREVPHAPHSQRMRGQSLRLDQDAAAGGLPLESRLFFCCSLGRRVRFEPLVGDRLAAFD